MVPSIFELTQKSFKSDQISSIIGPPDMHPYHMYHNTSIFIFFFKFDYPHDIQSLHPWCTQELFQSQVRTITFSEL